MEYKLLLTDALAYTRATFFEKWSRWVLFVLCAVPGLLSVVFWDRLCDGPIWHWELLLAVIVLQVAAVILFFPPIGYLARINRGTTTPPEFDNWGTLFVDGIRITVTYLLWFLPALILLLAVLGTILVGYCGLLTECLTSILLVLLIAALVVSIVLGLLYSDLGMIRCARTNSILEGLNISSLTTIIRTIGLVKYILAVSILLVLYVPFLVLYCTPDFIPYATDLIACLITPFYLVFSARYMTLLYNRGMLQQ